MLAVLATVAISCKKDKDEDNPVPPPVEQSVWLKDIVVANMPSPYYHFEYNAGKTARASFESGLRQYDFTYNGDRIAEVKNNTAVNKDRLQYVYNEAGQVELVKYSGEGGTVFKIVSYSYNNKGQVRQIEWETRNNVGFVIDRVMTLVYQADGNVQEITDHRPAIDGQPESTVVFRFEQYDNKLNVDGFSLLHEESDHLVLLPGVIVQKNNAGKLIRTGNNLDYTITYTYTYNGKNAPLTKTGIAVITAGPHTGQSWQSLTNYSYYE